MKKVAVYLPGVEMRGDTAETGYAITVLEGLVDSPAPRIDAEARDYGHGDFGQDLIWGASRQVMIAGTYFGDDQFGAGNVLKRLFGQHFEVVFELPSGTFRAEMYFSERVRWEPGGIDWADFELILKADDPRLYGPRLSGSTGVPTPGAGLSDPLLDPLQVGELVEDARNLVVNPRLVGGGTWAEVRRNRVIYPAFDGAGWEPNRLTNASVVNGVYSDTVAEVGYFPRITSTLAGRVPVTPAETVVFSARKRAANNVPHRAGLHFFASNGSPIGQTIRGTPVTGEGDRFFVTATAPAGASTVALYLGVDDNSATGAVVSFDQPLLESGTEVRPYFDGSTMDGSMPQPEDFRVRWLGPVNASESVMEGERVLAISAPVKCVAIRSGADAVRVIRTEPGFAHATFGMNGIAGPTTALLDMVRTSVAVPTPPRLYDGTIGALNSEMVAVDGVTYRGFTEATGWNTNRRIVARPGVDNPGNIGDESTYRLPGILAGDYDGPAFTGGDPAADGYIYSWAGEPDNSPSIRSVIAPGAEGNLARVSFTNSGTAPTEPIITVRGGVSEGFELLHVEAGRVIRCVRPIPDGSFVRVDNSRGEVWIDDQSPLPSTYLPVAEWFQVGAGESCTIQWAPLGAVTGTPEMVVEFAEASW